MSGGGTPSKRRRSGGGANTPTKRTRLSESASARPASEFSPSAAYLDVPREDGVSESERAKLVLDRLVDAFLERVPDHHREALKSFGEQCGEELAKIATSHQAQLDQRIARINENIKSLEEERDEWEEMVREAENPPSPSSPPAPLHLPSSILELTDSVLDKSVSNSQRLKAMTAKLMKEVGSIKHSTKSMHAMFEGLAGTVHALAHANDDGSPPDVKQLIRSLQPALGLGLADPDNEPDGEESVE